MNPDRAGLDRARLDRVGLDGEQSHWRVRIKSLYGGVLGAGTMLDTRHVLTCAHVLSKELQPPTEQVLVELVLLPGMPSARATVAAGFWVPVLDDERGDIAVLRLDRPLPSARNAPLLRLPLTLQQGVRAYGFPEGAEIGLWSSALLSGGGGPSGEWVQLQEATDAEPMTEGFSGAAATDADTGSVIGMVVAKPETPDGSVSRATWMIPVDTIVGYLPDLDAWVQGDPAVDRSFWTSPDSDAHSVPFAREFAGWLAHDETGQVRVVVTGESGSATAGGLRLAVLLADRERPRATDALFAAVPRDAVPPQGSVDLAVDAAGKTVEEVRRRLAGRLGIVAGEARHLIDRARRRLQPQTVVVDGIDDAAEPESLVADVILPLSHRAAELGIRLVLGFRRESSPGVTAVRSTISGVIPARLTLLQGRVTELAALEAGNAEQYAQLQNRFIDPPEVVREVPFLEAALAQLQAGTGDSVARKIAECEEATDRALIAARQLRARYEAMLRRREELRARLELYRARATDHRLALDLAHDEVHRELWVGRCDLVAAAVAVEGFGAEVRRAISAAEQA